MADIGITIGIDASQAADGAREFKRNTDDVATSAASASTASRTLKTSLDALGTGLASSMGGLKSSMDQLKESIAQLNFSGLAGQLQAVADSSKEVGSTFKESADKIATGGHQAAEGTNQLIEKFHELESTTVHETMEKVHKSLEILHFTLGSLGVASMAFEFNELLEAGKQLEDGFIHLQITAGQTGEAMEKFKDSAEQLSNTFGSTQISVVSAQIQVARAGFLDLAANTDVVTAALKLSKVSFTDLATSVSAVTEIMQAYGLEAKDAASVQESLFVASRNGRVDLGMLTTEFQRLIPAARESGASANEVLIVLNALGKSGVSPRIAMAGLQQALRSISRETPQSSAAFRETADSLAKLGVHATSLRQLIDEQGLVGAFRLLGEATDNN